MKEETAEEALDLADRLKASFGRGLFNVYQVCFVGEKWNPEETRAAVEGLVRMGLVARVTENMYRVVA